MHIQFHQVCMATERVRGEKSHIGAHFVIRCDSEPIQLLTTQNVHEANLKHVYNVSTRCASIERKVLVQFLLIQPLTTSFFRPLFSFLSHPLPLSQSLVRCL